MPSSDVVLSAPSEPLLASAAAEGNRATRARDALAGEGTTSTLPRSRPSTSADAASMPLSSELRRLSRGILLTDHRAALLASTVLFVLAAWPLALTEVPPYQDLPNHLAAITVIENPSRYPEYVFNGFFKTNAALFAWLFVFGKVVSTKMAAKLFALLVLAANAVVLPRFVLSVTRSRARMAVATLFAWPMVHNWFVSMGMLDFALAFPLSLGLLLALKRQDERPTVANGALVVGLGVVTWYAHVFPLLVVHMLLGIDVLLKASWKERLATARRFAIPLAPVTLLVVMSLFIHLRDQVGPMTGFIDHKKHLPAWELAYNMWAEWMWGYSMLTITSLVPTLLLGVVALLRRHESPRFFSGWATVALALLYAFLPYIITNWFHVNSRVIPYLWLALLLRVPDRLPKPVVGLLGLSAILYSAGMGVDFVRLEKEREEFTAGIPSVPEGARLLPLLFHHKASSTNTRNIMHFWGYYVTEKLTSAPLLFSHSHSFPVMYASPPPVRFNHLVLERFAPSMAAPPSACRNMLQANIVVDDCEKQYREVWAQFWADAMPRYDHLLLWDATPAARANVPPEYHTVFEKGRLTILARGDASALNVPAAP